ncbi:hypothetical protein VTN96DRAFT_992 [Rasamsonia emersonii]
MLRSNYSWCALPRIIERYEERQENLRREHPPAHARFETREQNQVKRQSFSSSVRKRSTKGKNRNANALTVPKAQ